MLVRWLPWLPEPGAWAGDISRLNSEGWRSAFLSEMGSVPASDTEPAADTEPASPSQPGLVVSSVGYNANNTTQKYFQRTKNIYTNVSKRRTLGC